MSAAAASATVKALTRTELSTGQVAVLATSGPGGKAKIKVSETGNVRIVLPSPISVADEDVDTAAARDMLDAAGGNSYQVCDLQLQSAEDTILCALPSGSFTVTFQYESAMLWLHAADTWTVTLGSKHSARSIAEALGCEPPTPPKLTNDAARLPLPPPLPHPDRPLCLSEQATPPKLRPVTESARTFVTSESHGVDGWLESACKRLSLAKVMHPRLAADSLVYQQGSTDDDDVLQMVVSRTGRLLVKYVDQRLSRMRSDEQDYMNEQFALAQELLRKGHAALHSSTDTWTVTAQVTAAMPTEVDAELAESEKIRAKVSKELENALASL